MSPDRPRPIRAVRRSPHLRGTGVLQLVAVLAAFSIPALCWLWNHGDAVDQTMQQTRTRFDRETTGWRPGGRRSPPRQPGFMP